VRVEFDSNLLEFDLNLPEFDFILAVLRKNKEVETPHGASTRNSGEKALLHALLNDVVDKVVELGNGGDEDALVGAVGAH
jgi:hypothetical protein